MVGVRANPPPDSKFMRQGRPHLPSLRVVGSNPVKRVAIAVVGGIVLAIGIALVVLPGPAFLIIPAGLAILAVEFVWAKRWLRFARAVFTRRRADLFSPRKKTSIESVRHSAKFLLRQACRTLTQKRKIL